MLRQLALRNLDALGVDHEPDFVKQEMEQIFSTLTSALPAGVRSEEALQNSIRNALDEA